MFEINAKESTQFQIIYRKDSIEFFWKSCIFINELQHQYGKKSREKVRRERSFYFLKIPPKSCHCNTAKTVQQTKRAFGIKSLIHKLSSTKKPISSHKQ